MAADVHRQRTYDAEAAAFEGTTMSDRCDLERLRDLARRVCATHWWSSQAANRPVTVLATRRDAMRSWARPATGRIGLTPVGHDLATLAHEMAHIAAGMDDVGHSPRFRALEVALVRLLAGTAPAERLASAFADAGLCVDDIAEPGDEGGVHGLAGSAERTSGDERRARAVVVKKLLTRAERTDSQAEAEACLQKATTLMAKHRIDDVLLAAIDGVVDDVVERRIHLSAGPYVQARTRLVEACAQAHGCVVYWRTGRTYNTVFVVGHADDVSAALTVHTMLSAHAAASLRSARPSGNALAWRRSFLIGYATTAAERLAMANTRAVFDADAAADTGVPSVSLALTARDERVEQFMREHHPSMRSVRPTPTRVTQARAAGSRAAREADLDIHRRLPSPPAALLSGS